MYNNTEFNRWRRHPWHGLHTRADGQEEGSVQVYIEMTPTENDTTTDRFEDQLLRVVPLSPGRS